MVDHTAGKRVKRQRDARLAEGWQEVKLWVPTEADAEDLRRLAAERRAKAEALDGLTQGVRNMHIETATRIAAAVANQGSAAFTTPSGPVLTLLTELATEGDLASFSRAFVIFARAKPANAAFVAGAVPAKISNYLIDRRGINAVALLKWQQANANWTTDLNDALRDPGRFEQMVENMAAAIEAMQKGH